MSTLLPIINTDLPDRRADVVFIHGLGGDVRATWQSNSSDDGFWPIWLGRSLKNVGIWSVGYDASVSSWKGYALGLEKRATNVLALMESDKVGDRPLIFITHSLGGLVAKQMLRIAHDSDQPNRNAIQKQTKGIVFLATPHAGSVLADWIRLIPFVRPTASMYDLMHNSVLS